MDKLELNCDFAVDDRLILEADTDDTIMITTLISVDSGDINPVIRLNESNQLKLVKWLQEHLVNKILIRKS